MVSQSDADTSSYITSASPDVSCSAREKSQPRNGAGEIFITAAAECPSSEFLGQAVD